MEPQPKTRGPKKGTLWAVFAAVVVCMFVADISFGGVVPPEVVAAMNGFVIAVPVWGSRAKARHPVIGYLGAALFGAAAVLHTRHTAGDPLPSLVLLVLAGILVWAGVRSKPVDVPATCQPPSTGGKKPIAAGH